MVTPTEIVGTLARCGRVVAVVRTIAIPTWQSCIRTGGRAAAAAAAAGPAMTYVIAALRRQKSVLNSRLPRPRKKGSKALDLNRFRIPKAPFALQKKP